MPYNPLGRVERDEGVLQSPEDFILLVSGGGHPTHTLWMPSFSTGVTGRPSRVAEAGRPARAVEPHEELDPE